jgi:sugar (pentulose or hexulose) kinase
MAFATARIEREGGGEVMTDSFFLGIDLGTSGVRCVGLNQHNETVAMAMRSFANRGADPRNPSAWAMLVDQAMLEVLASIDRDKVRGIAVDGTSGTMLAVDEIGNPVASPLMYDDPVADPGVLERILAAAPRDSAALGATSGLAKALVLQEAAGAAHLLHQADWIAARLSGRWGVSDENNALKTGYDPVARRWGQWIAATGLRTRLLPGILPAGTPIAPITAAAAKSLGLGREVQIVSGTTDGCASFLATGASQIGDAVTALGSSLTLKILSDRPIFSPAHGIYSHRIAGGWLAGGASNTGGKVLAAFFDSDRLAALSERIDPVRPARLDYYPLLANGERFPIADPMMPPRLSPRPADDCEFLRELLAGIAAIEARGYACLTALGGPRLRSVRSVGGGARNPRWTQMREHLLDVPFLPVRSGEAAAGVARLAMQALGEKVLA